MFAPAIIPLIYVFAFVAVVLMVQTVAELVFTGRDRAQRVNRRLTLQSSGLSREEVYRSLVRTPVSVGALNLGRFNKMFADLVRQAGVALAPERLLMFAGFGALGLFAMSMLTAFQLSGLALLSRLVLNALGAVIVASMGLWFWLQRRRTRRLKAIEEQLPNALDIISRALRAGHPVISAIHLAGDELGDPLGSEFGLIYDETTYGVDLEEALSNFAQRTGSPDVHYMAVSVSVQSETGGNLAEILSGLSTVIRGRSTLAKRVKSLASEGRASAALISALPLLVVSAQFLMHPETYTSKFSDPIFWPTVGVAVFLYAAGWLIIHRIINFKY